MNKVFIDFETYWDANHSLSKMDPISYVMHPMTEIQSVAIKSNDKPTAVVFGERDIRALFDRIRWSDVWAIGHNMEGFDSLILAHRFGVKPKLWGCTLAMARPRFAKGAGGSLKHIASALGVGEKLSLEGTNTKGKRLKDFTPEERVAMLEYNKVDTDLCAAIFNELISEYNTTELLAIDATIRMVAEPKFVADIPLLEQALQRTRDEKLAQLRSVAPLVGVDPQELDAAEQTKKALMSAAKFRKVLDHLGVPTPMKVSPTTGKEIPALAKSDEAFVALADHEDERVQAVVSARLGAKSTLLETRLEAFLRTAELLGGKMPMPLKYYGADTTGRWSGYIYNPQNLPRVSGKVSDALRKSLRAPKGYKVVVADQSGIELRVNHFLWQEPESMALFIADPEKADLYREFAATRLYDVAVSQVTKSQRQIGKLAQLGLGYGAAAATFRNVAKIMGGVDLSLDEASSIVAQWRQTYRNIVQGWRSCHEALGDIFDRVVANDRELGQAIDPWGLCRTSAEGIVTPGGVIRYPELRREYNEGRPEWVYGLGRKKARIYAGKVTENIVQHLARNTITGNLIAVRQLTGLCPVLTVHDELVYVVPEAEAEEVLATVQGVMRTPPKWWPELVVWSEGDIADTYGDAK